MKKKICFLIFIILFIIFEISMITISYKNNNVEKIIPNNYIIAFKGETSLKVNTTYIYKVKKKKRKLPINILIQQPPIQEMIALK